MNTEGDIYMSDDESEPGTHDNLVANTHMLHQSVEKDDESWNEPEHQSAPQSPRIQTNSLKTLYLQGRHQSSEHKPEKKQEVYESEEEDSSSSSEESDYSIEEAPQNMQKQAGQSVPMEEVTTQQMEQELEAIEQD